MKCSVGVALGAMVVLLCSVLTLVAAVGAAYMFLGPMSRQLFDPSVLPPGADLRMMRAIGVGSTLTLTMMGSVGIATGIGLIRLWRWARYSAIAFGVCVVAFSLVSAVVMLLIPMPPRTGGAPELPASFRYVLAGVYGVFALAGAGFVYLFARKKTAAQFAAGVSDTTPLRPVSLTIIALFLRSSNSLSFAAPSAPMFERVDDANVGLREIGAVSRDHRQAVRERGRGDQAVLGRHRPAGGTQAGEELCPR